MDHGMNGKRYTCQSNKRKIEQNTNNFGSEKVYVIDNHRLSGYHFCLDPFLLLGEGDPWILVLLRMLEMPKASADTGMERPSKTDTSSVPEDIKRHQKLSVWICKYAPHQELAIKRFKRASDGAPSGSYSIRSSWHGLC